MTYKFISEVRNVLTKCSKNKRVLLKFIVFIPYWILTLIQGKITKIVSPAHSKYKESIQNKDEIITEILGSKMILPTSDGGLSKDLIIYKVREANAVKVMKNELKEGMNIVEAGANIGYYTLLEAQKAKKVYAIEPNPNCFEYLKKNIKLNNLKNVSPLNIALGNKKGIIPFIFDKSWNLSRVAMNNEKNSIKIKANTLDNLFKNKKIDLIRMDVEGYELKILKGAEQTIKNNPKIKIFLEFHGSFLSTEERSEFVEFCKKNGLVVKHFFMKQFDVDREFSKNLNSIINAVPCAYHLLLESKNV